MMDFLKMNTIVGKQCGDFTVEKEIGRGTFGAVYLATRTDQRPICSGTFQPLPYALKMVDMRKSNRKEEIMIEREIQILSELKKHEHINIVKYVDFFTHDHYTCIVLEYCERGTLYEYIRDNKVIPEHLFVDILTQLASGLQFLHSKNILHRDIKSKNILINGHNDIKIGDFGVARQLDEALPGKLSLMVGSPQYMSPEMLSYNPYDEKTDIWSLGCTCYEMGTGDYAFQARSINEIKKLVKQKKLPPMTEANYCEDIKRLIMSMVQMESVNRPNARQVLEAVQKHKCRVIEDQIPRIENSKVAKVSPRPKRTVHKQTIQAGHQNDSGLSSGPASEMSTLVPSSSLEFTVTMDQQTAIDHFQNESCKYQAELVRLIGDHRASDKVSKIMKVMRKNPENYEKIKETVKKHVREDRFSQAYAKVLALKGAEEAISQMAYQSVSGNSSTEQ